MPNDFTRFLGLRTSEATPPPNSAKSCSGFVIDKVRGTLQNSEGYEKLFDLPVPATERLITNLLWKSAHKFHVPDHGGKDIFLAAATYTQGDYCDGTRSVNRWGVWARPYWGNILPEGDCTIETDIGDWVGAGNHAVSQSTTDARGGTHSMKVVVTGTGDATSNYVTLDLTNFAPSQWLSVGQRYVLRFYIESLSTVSLYVSLGGITMDGKVLTGTSSAVGEFTQVSYEFTALSVDPVKIWFSSNNTAYIDDIELKAWVDDWQELTEIYVCKVVANGTGQIQIGDGTGSTNLPASLFSTSYMRDWSIVREPNAGALGTTKRGQGYVVSDISWSGSDVYLQMQDLAAPANGFATNDVIYLMRSPALRGVAISTGHSIWPMSAPGGEILFDTVGPESRITPGTGVNDFPLAVVFRTKVFGWNPYSKGLGHVDGLFVDTAQMEFYAYALNRKASFISTAAIAGGDVALPTGDYTLRASLVFDDGQESQYLDQSNKVTISANEKVQYAYKLQLGAMPRRAKYIRVYASKDGGLYYLIATLDITTDLSWSYAYDANDFAAGVETGTQDLTGTEWARQGADESSQIGRDSANSGVIRYTRATTAGARRFAIGAVVEGVSQPNWAYFSAESGDGVSQWDVFPADDDSTIKVEYNDGDFIVQIAEQSERIFIFKQHSVVLLMPDNIGGYNRDVLLQNVGISSAESLVKFENSWVWADYSGIQGYGPNVDVSKPMNWPWLNDWMGFTTAQKEAVKAVIDRTLRKIRFYVAGRVYVYSFDSGEWLTEDNETPDKYVSGVSFTVDFLKSGSIYRVGSKTLAAGVARSISYVGNDFLIAQGETFDQLLDRISIQHSSTVDLTMSVYLDRSGTALFSQLVPAAVKTLTVKAPLFSVCKKFNIAFSASLALETDTVKIERITVYSDVQPAGDE